MEGGGITNVNCKDYALRTPLHVTVAATGPAGVNTATVVNALVSWGADVDAKVRREGRRVDEGRRWQVIDRGRQ
jgi:hypothetical protein